MIGRRRLASGWMGFALLGLSSLSQAGGETAGPLLEEAFGARPVAMGQAYVASGDDAYGFTFNPAVLSQFQRAQVASQFSPGVADVSVANLALAMPLSLRQGFGLNLAVLRGGDLEIFDASGDLSRTVKAQSDELVHMAYAFGPVAPPKGIAGGLHFGAGLKFLRTKIAEEASAQTLAADLGLLYRRPFENLASGTFGLSIQNLGGGLTFDGGLASGSVSEPLPLVFRIGAGFRKQLLKSDSLALSAEIDRAPKDELTTAALGGEYVHRGLIALRAGLRVGDDSGKINLGMGFRWKDFSLDYAVRLLDVFPQAHTVSMSYAFGIPWVPSKGLLPG